MQGRHPTPHPRVRANTGFVASARADGYPQFGPPPAPVKGPQASANPVVGRPRQPRRRLETRRARRVAAAAAAGLLGLSVYGVYATTLQVTGQAGTSMQAGSDLDVTVAEGCQTSAVAITETYTEGELNPETGYPEPQRTGFEVSNVLAACAGKSLTLAAKLDGTYQEIGTWVVNGTSHAFLSGKSGTTSGYSIRISESGS